MKLKVILINRLRQEVPPDRLPSQPAEFRSGQEKDNHLFQFLENLSDWNQFFFRWESIPDQQETEIAFQVTNYLFKYEPLYVARAETPIFDERFIGFGMTRNTQVRYFHLSF